jgi:hypothetical protein
VVSVIRITHPRKATDVTKANAILASNSSEIDDKAGDDEANNRQDLNDGKPELDLARLWSQHHRFSRDSQS